MIKKLKFKVLNILKKIRGSVSIILTIAFFALVIFEVFVLKRAISTVLDIARANPPVEASQLVRINFKDYDKIVKRVQDAPNYMPDQTISGDPFGTGKDDKK